MVTDDDPLATRSLDYVATASPREPAAATTESDPGPRIDRYRVERRLGAGGMGVVYLAHDPDLDRRVAIKVLRPELRAGQARLLREGQAIARLSHGNVITVFDVGTHGDDLFIAMAYVEGGTLGEWLAAAPRPWREVLDRFVAAGRGLAAAHVAGLVHRDFKPDNVLLGADGRVVVSDFGLARSDDATPPPELPGTGDVSVTRTGTVMGTPAYMSPEQRRGAAVDPRSDQFSFCVALWQGLYGRRPFEPLALPLDPTHVPSIVPPPAGPGVPARLERILRRGLSANPAARFSSMDELLAALQPGERRRWLGVGGAIAALAAVIALLWALRTRPSTTPAASCATEAARVDAVWNPTRRAAYLAGDHDPARSAEDAAAFDELARRWSATTLSVCQGPAAAPDRDAHARACLADALTSLRGALARPHRDYWPSIVDPRACVATEAAGAPAPRDLRTGLGRAVVTAALSPDGRRLAFATSDREATVMSTLPGDTATQALPPLQAVLGWPASDRLVVRQQGTIAGLSLPSGQPDLIAGAAGALSLSPDAAVAVFRDGGDLHFIGLADGVERAWATPPQFDDQSQAVWEPGGARIALTSAERVTVFELATGRSVDVPLRSGSFRAPVGWAGPGQLLIGAATEPGSGTAIWRAELTPSGELATLPWLLVPPVADTFAYPLAAGHGRLLVHQASISDRLYRVTGGVATRIFRTFAGWVRGGDATAGRFAIDSSSSVALLAADGTTIEDRAVDGGGRAWLRDGELTALDPAIVTPGLVLRCSTWAPRSCMLIWTGRSDSRIARYVDGRIGPPRPWARAYDLVDVSADGRRALSPGWDASLHEFDLDSGVETQIFSDPACIIQLARYGRDGRTVIYVGDCDGAGSEFEIRAVSLDRPAEIRTVQRGPEWFTGLELLGDDDLVYSARVFAGRLTVVDGILPAQ